MNQTNVLLSLLLLTPYSNKLDLVFYISHKLMDYLHHFKIIKIKYISTYKYKKFRTVKNIGIDKLN